jgi:Fe-S-cluster containining protein
VRPARHDCTRCGACCINPPENVAEGYADYIEVTAKDALWRKRDVLDRYTRESAVPGGRERTAGRRHLRILADQRCMALLGRPGERVRCSIYALRPAPCRRVEAGSELCEWYRRGQGLSVG